MRCNIFACEMKAAFHRHQESSMYRAKRCVVGILAASMLLFLRSGLSVLAQDRTTLLSEATQLNQRVEELYPQARFVEAMPLAKRALALREKILGPIHPDVAESLNNL